MCEMLAQQGTAVKDRMTKECAESRIIFAQDLGPSLYRFNVYFLLPILGCR